MIEDTLRMKMFSVRIINPMTEDTLRMKMTRSAENSVISECSRGNKSNC